MTPLPSGLADALHLPFPVPWKWIALIAALFLAIVMAALFRAWVKRRRRAPTKTPPVPVAPVPVGIVDEIEAIRGRHLGTGTFRLACHELSALLRRYFEGSGHARFSTLTAGEILRQLGKSGAARFFGSLAALQFGRERPTRRDLDGVCDLAIEVVREGRP